MNFKKNIKQASCVKDPNLMVLWKRYFSYLREKFDFEKLSTFILIEVTFLS